MTGLGSQTARPPGLINLKTAVKEIGQIRFQQLILRKKIVDGENLKMATWRCIEQCGACCNLDPSDRPEVEDYLSPQDWQLYLSLVGSDGWCIHYDRITRRCKIYADRPRFCRVEADVFTELYDIEPEELNDFAISCCQEQIEAVYGDRALELHRFNHAVDI